MRPPSTSIRPQELAFRTQYAELKERVLASGPLLPGTPGTLVRRQITGRDYWYRVYYPVPGKQADDYVCGGGETDRLEIMRSRIEFAQWVASQVRNLRGLGFQVGSKPVARVLVEIYNKGAVGSGLVLVGTQAYMAMLNELGAVSVAAMTLDIDLAVNAGVKLAVEEPFLQTLRNTRMPFVEVPGLRPDNSATSAKLPGADGLRVDLLTSGPRLGEIVPVPALEWGAQTIPYFDYLLKDPEPAAVLAGDHCIPVYVPQPARFVWHKLYASLNRHGFKEKAAKDRLQALTLARALTADADEALAYAFEEADPLLREELRRRLPKVLSAAELSVLQPAWRLLDGD